MSRESAPPEIAHLPLAGGAGQTRSGPGPEAIASRPVARRYAPVPSSARGSGEARLAIGVGFRKRCTAETLVALVREACARLPAGLEDRPAVLATIAEKDRPALHDAAVALGLGVVILGKDALRAADDRITVESEAARACLGIPSVAEAAALAAAGAGAGLLVTRIAVADATCAIAAIPTEPA